MKTIEQEMQDRTEAKLDAFRTCLKFVEEQIESMPAAPHEMLMIKASIEGCIIGNKNYLRSLK